MAQMGTRTGEVGKAPDAPARESEMQDTPHCRCWFDSSLRRQLRRH
nr:MAG TPA: hypothetical protein [Caudoviricetes sp.]